MKKQASGLTAVIVAAVALAAGFTSCKGRTMENMQPTGDTVEVDVITTAGDTDSVPAVVSVEP